MDRILYGVLIILAAFFCPTEVKGQSGRTLPDSIPVLKAKRNQEIYQFQGIEERLIKFQAEQPDILYSRDKKPVGDAADGLITLVTGLGMNTSRDVIWNVRGTISANDTLPAWNISLFCEGNYSKERERVRDEDGSVSVETQKTKFLYWDKNATGTILEWPDTIGIFLIVMDPRSDSLLLPWSEQVFSQGNEAEIQVPVRKFSFKNVIEKSDYGITGTLRKKNFMIISNASSYRSWIYLDNKLVCIFRSDMDDELTRKQERVMPYLLTVPEINPKEKRDLYRLAIMSRLLGRLIRPVY